jgi:hypothetical protein
MVMLLTLIYCFASSGLVARNGVGLSLASSRIAGCLPPSWVQLAGLQPILRLGSDLVATTEEPATHWSCWSALRFRFCPPGFPLREPFVVAEPPVAFSELESVCLEIGMVMLSPARGPLL